MSTITGQLKNTNPELNIKNPIDKLGGNLSGYICEFLGRSDRETLKGLSKGWRKIVNLANGIDLSKSFIKFCEISLEVLSQEIVGLHQLKDDLKLQGTNLEKQCEAVQKEIDSLDFQIEELNKQQRYEEYYLHRSIQEFQNNNEEIEKIKDQYINKTDLIKSQFTQLSNKITELKGSLNSLTKETENFYSEKNLVFDDLIKEIDKIEEIKKNLKTLDQDYKNELINIKDSKKLEEYTIYMVSSVIKNMEDLGCHTLSRLKGGDIVRECDLFRQACRVKLWSQYKQLTRVCQTQQMDKQQIDTQLAEIAEKLIDLKAFTEAREVASSITLKAPFRTAILLNISLSLARNRGLFVDILEAVSCVVGSQYYSTLERLILTLADEGKVDAYKFYKAVDLLKFALLKGYVDNQNRKHFELLFEEMQKRSGCSSKYGLWGEDI